MSEAVHADAAPKPVGQYPHARRVGDLLFLSGIGPRDPASNAIVGEPKVLQVTVGADRYLFPATLDAQP